MAHFQVPSYDTELVDSPPEYSQSSKKSLWKKLKSCFSLKKKTLSVQAPPAYNFPAYPVRELSEEDLELASIRLAMKLEADENQARQDYELALKWQSRENREEYPDDY